MPRLMRLKKPSKDWPCSIIRIDRVEMKRSSRKSMKLIRFWEMRVNARNMTNSALILNSRAVLAALAVGKILCARPEAAKEADLAAAIFLSISVVWIWGIFLAIFLVAAVDDAAVDD